MKLRERLIERVLDKRLDRMKLYNSIDDRDKLRIALRPIIEQDVNDIMDAWEEDTAENRSNANA